MEKSVGFVLMLDVSGSMNPAMTQVKINANTFLSQGIVGDQFAVNVFDDTAHWVYPKSSNDDIVSVTSGKREIVAASVEIEKLISYGLTNITAAIGLGNGMIKKASTDVKAFILLSDGGHNASATYPDEVLGNEPPLYVAGLGNCQEASFAKMLKKNTTSQFYYQPRAFEMMYMFNQIRADAAEAALVANNLHELTAGSYFTLDNFSVGKDAHSIVSVTWPDKSYVYTDGMARDNQIFVDLINADNKRLSIKPTIAGAGFCMFELKDVKAGNWKVITEYSTPKKFTSTVGVIDRNPAIRTTMSTPNVSKVNEPITVDIAIGDGSSPCENAIVGVHLVRHGIAKNQLELNAHSDTDTAKVKFTTHKTRQLLTDFKDGRNTFTINDTRQPGIYTVEIEVEGKDNNGQMFTQKKTSSIVVE